MSIAARKADRTHTAGATRAARAPAAAPAAALLPKAPKKAPTPARTRAAQRLLKSASGAQPIAFDPKNAAGYAGLAREALRAYLPEGDVDSVRTLTQEYFRDPRYVHALSKDAAGRPQYIAGFTHTLAIPGMKAPLNVAQLDYHSMAERRVPDLAAAKPALDDFMASATAQLAAAKAGGLDVVFVEVTEAMAKRYEAIDPRFVVFAGASSVRAAGKYALLALPLNDEAARALRDRKTEVFSSYVDSWVDTNLQSDPAKPKHWRKVRGNVEIVETMKRTGKWGQPHLP